MADRRRKSRHPLQPLVRDAHGVVRFKKNAIVSYLLEAGPFDMNSLAIMDFSNEDREQFAQLIGYSLSGFSELSYVSNRTFNAAEDQPVHGKERQGAQMIDTDGTRTFHSAELGMVGLVLTVMGEEAAAITFTVDEARALAVELMEHARLASASEGETIQ